MVKARRKVVINITAHMELTKRMRELRESFGYSQGHVAKRLNLSRSQYTSLESGRSMINFDQLVTLAHIYLLTPSELLAKDC